MSKEELATIPAGMEGMISTARPEGVDIGDIGTSHIGREDMLMPRLALAQKTSKEIDPTDARYIEGLKFTDLFHSINGKIYGHGPIYFSILKADPPRYVEFRPFEEGGGMIDPNVPAGDPRTRFGDIDPATKRSRKPAATKFYDFIVLMLNDLDLSDPLQNVMALSFKSTGIAAARALNLIIQQRGKKELYKGAYRITSDSDTKNGFTFAVYKPSNANWLTPGSPVETIAAEMYEGWKDREAKIDREGPDAEDLGGDASFDHGANVVGDPGM